MHITEPLPGEKRARLVFGLDWRAYPVKGAKDERKRYADDFMATHYVEMTVAGEMIGGFGAPDLDGLRRVTLYSGAARVAMLERVRAKQAVLVLMQDAQRVHLVYVVRGAVCNDEVLSLQQAQRRRDEITQQCEKLALALTVLTSGKALADGDEPFSPAELLALGKAGKLARVPAGVPNLVIVLLALGVLGFGMKQAFNVISPPDLPITSGPSWSQQYRQAVDGAFAGARPYASALAPRLLDVLGPFGTNRVGWQFDHAECGTSGFCTLTYSRMGGSFEDFARAAPASMLPLTFARNGLTLGARGPAIPRVAAVSSAQARTWPSEEQLVEMLQTPPQRLSTRPFDLKSFGYTVHIEPSQPLLSSPPPPHEQHGPLIRAGKWEIDGYRWQAPLLSLLPSNMTLETLDVKLDTAAPDELGKVGIHFVAKGKYYVVQ